MKRATQSVSSAVSRLWAGWWGNSGRFPAGLWLGVGSTRIQSTFLAVSLLPLQRCSWKLINPTFYASATNVVNFLGMGQYLKALTRTCGTKYIFDLFRLPLEGFAWNLIHRTPHTCATNIVSLLAIVKTLRVPCLKNNVRFRLNLFFH
jgi:hypothetical protein